ncbi:hypothetical protein MO973_22255 [Paenibacillus sp. TRM 82003]|nr:hypothetical protein [Paenibacillus sp. TRM 82003]
MAKVVRVKNYRNIVRKAKQKVRVKGKVKIKGYVGGGYGGGCGGGYGGYGAGAFGPFSGTGANAYGAVSKQPFVGPTLQQRLYGWTQASTLVTVNLENSTFRGRVISVDGNGFEVTVTDPLTSVFTPGAIVYVNFNQVNAVSAGNF